MRAAQNLTAKSPVRPVKFPLGMILILVWVGSTILTGLVMLDPLLFFVIPPRALGVFGGILLLLNPWLGLEGRSFLGMYTIFLAPVLLGASFYGILVRRGWARPLVMCWSAYSFALSLYEIIRTNELSYVLFERWRFRENIHYGAVTLLVLHLLGVGINAIVAMYVYRKRGFFGT